MSDLNFGFGLRVEGLPETTGGVQQVAERLEHAGQSAALFRDSATDAVAKIRNSLAGLNSDLTRTHRLLAVQMRMGAAAPSQSKVNLPPLTIQSLKLTANNVILSGQIRQQNAAVRNPAQAIGPTYGFAPTTPATAGTYGLADPDKGKSLAQANSDAINQAAAAEREAKRSSQFRAELVNIRAANCRIRGERVVVEGERGGGSNQSQPKQTKLQEMTLLDRFERGVGALWSGSTRAVGYISSTLTNALSSLSSGAGRLAKFATGGASSRAAGWIQQNLPNLRGLAVIPQSISRLGMSIGGSIRQGLASSWDMAKGVLEKLPIRMGIGAAAAGAAGLTSSGFSGTVEFNRFQTELQLLGREFASAMKPYMEWLTSGIRSLRRWIEGFDAAEQKLFGLSLIVAKVGGLFGGLVAPMMGLTRLLGGLRGGAGAAGVANLAAQVAANAAAGGGGIGAAGVAGGVGAGALARLGIGAAGVAGGVAKGVGIGAPFALGAAGIRAKNDLDGFLPDLGLFARLRTRSTRMGDIDQGKAIAERVGQLSEMEKAGLTEQFAMAKQRLDRIKNYQDQDSGESLSWLGRRGRDLRMVGSQIGAAPLLEPFGFKDARVGEDSKIVAKGLLANEAARQFGGGALFDPNKVKPGAGIAAAQAAAKKEKDAVMLAQGGFAAAGATFEDVQTAALMNDTGETEKQKAERMAREAGADPQTIMIELLTRLVANTMPKDPDRR